MRTVRYNKAFEGYWKIVDDKIFNLITKHCSEKDRLLEVGFGSGHYLAALTDAGFRVEGIEIRKKEYDKTQALFDKYYPEVNLIFGDAKQLNTKYDMIYSTGLLQCLPTEHRRDFICHLSDLAPKAIFVVPKIIKDRNMGSEIETGVSGCKEYETQNIAYELSLCYGYVENGVWEKEAISLEDDFVWFYCNNARKR